MKHPRMGRVLTLIHGPAFYYPLSFFLNIGDAYRGQGRNHRPHSMSQFLLVQMIFLFSISKHWFSWFCFFGPTLCKAPPAPIVLLQIISNSKKNSDNNAGYLPAGFEQAVKAQKHKRMQNKDALVVKPFLKTSLYCGASSKTWQWSGCSWAETSARRCGWKHHFSLCSLVLLHLIDPSLVKYFRSAPSFQLLCHREMPHCAV